MALKDQKDVLIAWINGETIEVKLGDHWSECDDFNNRVNIFVEDGYEYRIKPKEIVTTTYIQFDKHNAPLHSTFSRDSEKHNLRLTWAEDGKTLLKAEVI
jgi:hypothetical protein